MVWAGWDGAVEVADGLAVLGAAEDVGAALVLLSVGSFATEDGSMTDCTVLRISAKSGLP